MSTVEGRVALITGASSFNFQKQVVKAALSGDRQEALYAFLLDPNTQSHLDLEQTQALLDEMLEANKAHLPLFQSLQMGWYC